MILYHKPELLFKQAGSLILVKGRVIHSVNSQGIRNEIEQIRVATLILVGDQDVAVPLIHSRYLHEAIARSRLVIISGAGHTSTVEEPTAVNAAISEFLDNQ